MGFGKKRAEKQTISDDNADSIKTKRAAAVPKFRVPFYTEDKKYSRGQRVARCDECKDTSFELLENKQPTEKCCRCGKPFVN